MTDTAASEAGTTSTDETAVAASTGRSDAATSTRAGPDPVDATRIDPHVKLLNERVVARAKDRGLDALVYAPHFTRLSEIRRRAERFSDEDLLVVPAREVFTGTWRNRQHVLAIGLSEPVPDFISLAGALSEFERQDAAVLVPHPGFLNVSLNRETIRANVKRIDAVETHNFKTYPQQNRRARELADEAGLPGFGSSYAHLLGSVGEVWTTFDREIGSESDIVAAFKRGTPRRVLRRQGARHAARGIAEFAHLGYENSWKKIDRLFLSGTEPTHPGHVAYDGRFEDVREY